MKWYFILPIILIQLTVLLFVVATYENIKRTNKFTKEYYKAKINEIGKQNIINNIKKVDSSV